MFKLAYMYILGFLVSEEGVFARLPDYSGFLPTDDFIGKIWNR